MSNSSTSFEPTAPSQSCVPTAVFAADAPGLPPWVMELLSPAAARDLNVPAGLPLSGQVAANNDWALVRLRIADAVELSAADLQQATTAAYALAAAELQTHKGNSNACHPVRFWNYIPHIHFPMSQAAGDVAVTRYMVFNAGRFEAFSRWYGAGAFDRNVATASGVGYLGRDLLIDVLASSSPGKSVANPRQVPPYHYSRRFGPRPPCFARATLMETSGAAPVSTCRLLVGGTASVRGEDSLHEGDLAAQLDETFKNLDSLLGAAAERAGIPRAANGAGANDRHAWLHLDWFDDLRVYYVRPEFAQPIEQAVHLAMPRLRRLQMTPAELCRPELLVEIEGVARIPATSRP